MNEYIMSLLVGGLTVICGAGIIIFASEGRKIDRFQVVVGIVLCGAGAIIVVVGPIMFGSRY